MSHAETNILLAVQNVIWKLSHTTDAGKWVTIDSRDKTIRDLTMALENLKCTECGLLPGQDSAIPCSQCDD